LAALVAADHHCRHARYRCCLPPHPHCAAYRDCGCGCGCAAGPPASCRPCYLSSSHPSCPSHARRRGRRCHAFAARLACRWRAHPCRGHARGRDRGHPLAPSAYLHCYGRRGGCCHHRAASRRHLGFAPVVVEAACAPVAAPRAPRQAAYLRRAAYRAGRRAV
jgi:hypothetical protein